VCGTDINPEVKNYLLDRKIPYEEEYSEDYLSSHTINWLPDIISVLRESEIVFVPIQTPHDSRFEGTSPIPNERADFNYTFLVKAMQEISASLDALEKDMPVVIISTVLPGTIEREIFP